jgi:galactokinase
VSPAARFARRFGFGPQAAASAPGRVNLIGEHTDYNDGWVLPMAIDRRARVLLRSAEGESSIWAADREDGPGNPARIRLDAAPPPRLAGFERYVAGPVIVLREWLGGQGPRHLHCLLTSDVPAGAGLSSSAAIEVATMTALESLCGVHLDPLTRARLCQSAEHRFGGTPCGIMDMLVACAAVEGHALLIDCRAGTWRPLALPPQDRAVVLVVDTGVAHELSGGAYAQRRAACAAAATALGVPALRDATPAMVEAGRLDPMLRRRARHVVDENARTLAAAESLAAGDLEGAGELMFQSHASLRDLYEVSCPELDAVVSAAEELRGRGVFGARMTGGGFGGSAVLLCAAAESAGVGEHVVRRFAERFRRPPRVFATRPCGAARVEAVDA